LLILRNKSLDLLKKETVLRFGALSLAFALSSGKEQSELNAAPAIQSGQRTLSNGRIGFGTRDGEEFIVQFVSIIPTK